MSAHAELASLTAELQQARKYATLDPTLVQGVLGRELDKGRRGKAAIKAAKTKLHQMTGAYRAGALDYATWLDELGEATSDPARATLCQTAMHAHASTRERLPYLTDFYARLFVDLPPAPRVLDLACGLNPLALPWMPLPAAFEYWACDIDRAQIEFLNAYFEIAGVDGRAQLCDLVHGDLTAFPQAQVILLLKTIPCLEQLDSQIGARLLAALDCRVAFVSFPTRSLGGKTRGMSSHYADHFAEIAPPGYAIQRLDFPNELVFRLDRA